MPILHTVESYSEGNISGVVIIGSDLVACREKGVAYGAATGSEGAGDTVVGREVGGGDDIMKGCIYEWLI